jgi:translocation and assembly module TamA
MRPAGARALLALLAAAPGLARADIDLKVEGVEGAIRDNVIAYLSLSRYAGIKDLDAETVERLGQRARREVAQALRPFGYYEPEVTTEVTPDGRKWKARVKVKPGSAVRMTAVRIEITGPGRDEPFLRGLTAPGGLKPGRRLSHAAYDDTKGNLERTAEAYGYLDAHYTTSDLEVDVERREARATLVLDTGPRYRFGATTIEQDTVREELVRRYLRYRDGDWYDSGKLLATQFALDDTQYFAVVEVLPDERDRERLIVPVQIRANKGPRSRYTIAAGYATDTEWRGTLGWQNRRVNHKGHRFKIEARYARTEQSLTGTYVIPWRDPALEKLSFELSGARTEINQLETSDISLRTTLTRVRGNWQRGMFATATRQTTRSTDAGQTIPKITDRLLVPGISIARLPAGYLGQQAINTGFYAELTGSHGALGANTDFLRFAARDERRFDLAPGWHLIARAEIGLSWVQRFSLLQREYRFFAGGDRSVRGFGLDDLSPLETDAVTGERIRVGGRHLIVGSVEIERDVMKSFALAAFVDAGNAVDRFGDPLAWSAGLGVRWKLPFISIGLDIAQAVHDPTRGPGEKRRGPRLHLNIAPVF